jgi:hypothetical protein
LINFKIFYIFYQSNLTTFDILTKFGSRPLIFVLSFKNLSIFLLLLITIFTLPVTLV